MVINKKQNEAELLVEIEGSIDTIGAPLFDKEVNNCLKGITSLVLDFKKVDYVSSAGLRVLLVAYKTMLNQGTMVLHNVNQDIMDVFSMTGFDLFLQIE